MSPVILAWALSLAGAALFFGAGALFALRRAASRPTAVEPSVTAGAIEGARAEVDVAHQALAAARAELIEARRERDHYRTALAGEHTSVATLSAERDRLRAEQVQLAGVVAERDRLHMSVSAIVAERDRLRTELERDRATMATLTHERDRLRGERNHFEKAARETAARAEQARRDAAALVEEVRHRRQSAPHKPVVPDSGARGDALRSILDEETRGSGFAGAVIADELGLVVAATGEYGDALAAYGAFLAEVGAKTRDALPLHELRQVIVQDDHDMTLTVRPIASAEDNLALVTLAAGRNGATPRASTAPER